ncbi:MAG: heavy metal-binding domain-containing protein [Rhodobacteraceae bacterium]|nr:heavy metal-binding domain-containing protein [Paracoccaceae bacterium]
MPACHGCHKQFNFPDLDANWYCDACAAERARIRRNLTATMPSEPSKPKIPPPTTHQERRKSIVMTTETALDIQIKRRLGIVTAEAVVGMNVFKDLMFEMRDLVGGRSKTQQNAMRDVRDELFNRLKDDAAQMKADMIVGVSLRFSDFGSRGNAILAAAIGTAVQIEPAAKNES